MLKMRKLVLGIIFLISVQFAFVTYMMVQQFPVQLAEAPIQTEPSPNTSHPVQIPEVNNSPEIRTEPETAAPGLGPRHTNRGRQISIVPERAARVEKPTLIHVSKPAFKPTPSRTAAPVEFENVVIRYNRDPDSSDCEVREIPKTKKRSYVAKAVPVLKKPWEWMKAIGSKLN